MKIAVFGGSFDPVHIGHLALADAVRTELGYDLVLFVPAYISPHKADEKPLPASIRLDMLSRALEGRSGFAVEPCELERGGVSYTIDTLNTVRKKFEFVLEGKPGLVIGADLIPGFSRWKNPDAIAETADIILASRPVAPVPAGGKLGTPALSGSCVHGCGFFWPHTHLSNTELSISSTAIREAIRNGGSWRYLVPDPVYRYITACSVYE